MAAYSDEDYDDDLHDDWEDAADEKETLEEEERKRRERRLNKNDILDDDAEEVDYVDANAHISAEAKRARERAAERAQDAANAAALLGGTNIKMVEMKPQSEAEFADYAHRLSLLLHSQQHMAHYTTFVKKLTELVAKTLRKEQLHELSRILRVAQNESSSARKQEEKRHGSAALAKKSGAPVVKKTGLNLDVDGRGGGIAADADEDFM